jgi:5-methylcytosine-specific restriction endonuclease McrA
MTVRRRCNQLCRLLKAYGVPTRLLSTLATITQDGGMHRLALFILFVLNCGVETVPAEQHKKGVTPPKNETHVDHVVPRAKGGTGEPDNGQVLCRECNIQKSDNEQ